MSKEIDRLNEEIKVQIAEKDSLKIQATKAGRNTVIMLIEIINNLSSTLLTSSDSLVNAYQSDKRAFTENVERNRSECENLLTKLDSYVG